MNLKAWTRKLQDLIMPPIVEDVVEEDDVLERGEAEAEKRRATFRTVSAAYAAHEEMAEEAEDIRIANGGTIHLTRSPYEEQEASQERRPKLTVHQAPQLKVRVYVPSDFEQVTAIADDLRAKKAVIVNYEKVEAEQQRRICDFINGSCYVTDGGAKRISDYIVLYVPEGVNVSEAMSVALEK